MSGKTEIEWTQATWNPTKGCDRVSPGCDHCYAMTMAKRLKGMGSAEYQQDGDSRTSGPGFLAHESPADMDWPLHKRKPLRIFVNSMSDLFHASISDDFIVRVFAVMAATPRHTYQILTKRHARMRSLLSSELFQAKLGMAYVFGADVPDDAPVPLTWPLPNVWLGVSVENQQWADIRIPALIETPAAVRFLSCEPLLGPLDLHLVEQEDHDGGTHPIHGPWADLNWVIVGGESGPGARLMQLDWAQDIRDQCVGAGVPFLFKQWGAWEPTNIHSVGYVSDPAEQQGESYEDERYPGYGWRRLYRRVGKKAAGRELDGRTWDEYPAGSQTTEGAAR